MSDYNIIYPKTLIDNSTPLTYETWNSSTDSIIGIKDEQEFNLAPLWATAWSCNNIFIIPVIRNVDDLNETYFENPLGVTQGYIEQAFNNDNEIFFYFIDLSNDQYIMHRLIELEYYSGNLFIGFGVTINSSGLIRSYDK